MRQALEREPWEVRLRVSLTHGSLPSEFLGSAVLPGSISGILCGDVIHFLAGPELLPAFTAMCDALVPNGLLALTCASPYVFKGFALDAVEAREEAGIQWPGFLDEDAVS